MSLHKHTLSLDPTFRPRHSHQPPHIHEVLRHIQAQQIKQHCSINMHTPQRNLIDRTKKILSDYSYSERANNTISDRLSSSIEGKRGMTARLKSRRDYKLNETKKQLELLNEVHKHTNMSQIVVVGKCRKDTRISWSRKKQKYTQLLHSTGSRGIGSTAA
jgi:hypothetical protein